MSESLQFGKTRIEFALRRSHSRKHLGITVQGQAVTISAPHTLAKTQIHKLVRKKAAWIIAKLDLNSQVPPDYPRKLVSGETLQYLGRQYILRVGSGSPSVKLRAGKFLLTQDDHEQGTKLIKDWYKNHLAAQLNPVVEKYAALLDLPTPHFQIRDLGKRWASCGKNGVLYFHWQLARLPTRSITFVVAHEVVHLREPHHSKEFRRLLQLILPDEANRAGSLSI